VEPRETYTRRLAAIAFADVAGWSRLIEQNDAATLTMWKAVRSGLIEPKIQEHSGRLLEVAGDAVLVEFPSAVAAVRWALDLQRGLGGEQLDAGPATRLTMRVGVNVEDVIVDGDKLIGDGVNVASRIQQLAEPGEIVVTKAVRDHVRNKMAVSFEDLGERRAQEHQPDGQALPGRGSGMRRPGRRFPRFADRWRPASALLTVERIPRSAAANEGRWLARVRTDPAGRISAFQAVARRSRAGRCVGVGIPHRPRGGRLRFHDPKRRGAANAARDADSRPILRMGIETGELSAERQRDAETRLSAQAERGDILVSAAVRDQLIDGLDVSIEDLGERTLQTTGQTVRTFRVSPARTASGSTSGPRPLRGPAFGRRAAVSQSVRRFGERLSR
jgi:class 3 adenylate cyclase